MNMNMNMFEDFAKINISGNNNGNIDKNNNVEKNIKKNKKIIHGNNVIFTRGQYKGYNGFMYELNSETLDVEIEEYEYVGCSMYGEYKNGTSIITNRGNSVIINKIDKMYALKLKKKESYFEIRLFTNQVSRFLCIYEDNMKKVVQIINEYNRDDEISYDIVKLDLEYKKYYNNQELMYMVSYFVCNGKYNSIATQHVRNVKLNGGEEFWMVVKSPDNKDDVNYIGNFGKLSRTIPEQYLIKYKKTILVNNNSLIINEDKVTFKRGPYKNRTGVLKNLNSSNLVIEVDAIGKKISSHIVKNNNSYKNRNIISDDLFFKDIELSNGNFFQVKECTENGFIGIEKIKNNFVEREILNNDKSIKKLMSGFCIVNDRKVMSFEKDTDQLEMEVIEENESEDVDDDEENDEGSYNDDGGDKNDIVFDSEVEMKQSFKDSERLEFVNRVLSKDDKNIMKLIEKCLVALSFSIESIKVYDVLESINDAIQKMKSELAKLGIIDWKTTDTKYIVACLVIYDILKNGYNFSKTSFNNFISKLFNTSFFKKNDITESMFIQSDEHSKIETCFDLIRMNSQKKIEMKKFYKLGNVFEIVKMMMENCNTILQKWFGPVILSCLDEDVELFPVCKKVKENTKKFLTTQDILNNNIVESADRVIWGPSTSKMISIWKSSLVKKCETEEDEKLKLVYKFVIDNFENAPFVLRNMDNNITNNLEILKYKELKRAFDTFVVKLKKFTDRTNAEKIDKLKIKSDEKKTVLKRRNEIEMNHLNISFEKKVRVC